MKLLTKYKQFNLFGGYVPHCTGYSPTFWYKILHTATNKIYRTGMGSTVSNHFPVNIPGRMRNILIMHL